MKQQPHQHQHDESLRCWGSNGYQKPGQQNRCYGQRKSTNRRTVVFPTGSRISSSSSILVRYNVVTVVVVASIGILFLSSLPTRTVNGQQLKTATTTGHDTTTATTTIDLRFDSIKMTIQSKKRKNNHQQSDDGNNNSDKENDKDNIRIILDGSIRGRAQPGRLVAIMGPSGAGKSTLLHAIAGRIRDTRSNNKIQVYGRRFMNGIPVDGTTHLPCALIEQEVNFFPHRTVRETLEFYIQLKGVTTAQNGTSSIHTTANQLMEQMGLSKVADTIVGNTKVRGISGGERKRLSIALELISSPALILLDEPTSGLDSTAATGIIQSLRTLATVQQKTILAVIHQPSQHVFNQFDDILLVSNGKLMYFGERVSVRTFMEQNGCYSTTTSTNNATTRTSSSYDIGTAEYILDCISTGPIYELNESDIDAKKRVDQIATAAANKQQIVEQIKPTQRITTDSTALVPKSKKSKPHANILVQYKLLFQRSFQEVFRGKTAIILKMIQQLSTAIIYGSIYSLSTDTQGSIMDRFGLLNLIVIGTLNLGLSKTIRAFPREKNIVATEIASNLYTTFPYLLAKAISEIPIGAVLNSIFGTVVYYLTGLQKTKFVEFLALLLLHGIVTEGAGLVVGSISPNTDTALAAFPAIVVLSVIMDGRNLSEETTPSFLRWISKIGLIRWAYEGFCTNEFTGLSFTIPTQMGPPGTKLVPTIVTGTEALARFGMGKRTVYDIMKIQFKLISSFWFISYLGLRFTKQKFIFMQEP